MPVPLLSIDICPLRNPVTRTNQCPVARRDPHGTYRVLLIIEYFQCPDRLAGRAIRGELVTNAIETNLIATGFLFGRTESAVGIQVQFCQINGPGWCLRRAEGGWFRRKLSGHYVQFAHTATRRGIIEGNSPVNRLRTA